MSKIKPDTRLPLFGTETDWRPPPRYLLSLIFPVYEYNEAAAGFALDSVEIISPPAVFLEAAGQYGLVGVTIVTPPPPPDNVPVDGGAGAGHYQLLGVEIVAVDLGAKEFASANYSLVGVRVDTTLILSEDAATSAYSLLGVEII